MVGRAREPGALKVVRTVYPNGLGQGFMQTVSGWLDVFKPWGYAYRPSQPAPVPAGAKLGSPAEVYTLLNRLVSVIQGGLERARGDQALTSEGEAYARDLAQAYQRAGRDIEWARAYLPAFAASVYGWANRTGLSKAGGARAFEQAVTGSSVARQAGGVIAEAAEGTLDVGGAFSEGTGRWLLPIGAGLLLILLLRR